MIGTYSFTLMLLLILGGTGIVSSQIITPPSYSISLETELRDWLFGTYEIKQRPEKLNRVRITLNLLSLNYLDIKEQALSVTAYFTFEWTDSRLSWIGNLTYNNVIFLFSDEKSVWKPPIIVENSVNDIDVISRPSVPMRIDASGKINWLPAGIFTTNCESHVTYWPFDTQTCDIVLSTWSYTVSEIQLEFNQFKTKILTDFYQENGEWELISTGYESLLTLRESESFSRLVFSLTFRRRIMFHSLNTLFPVVLMAFLTVIIFKLNPESGERVGLALTILLAFAVYLGVISESIPQTSLSASLLSSYIACILFLQTLAVFLTVLYLDAYFNPEDKPVPKWLKTMTSLVLVKLACVDCSKRNKKVSPNPNNINNENDTYSRKHSPGFQKNEKIVSIEDTTEDKNEVWEEVNDSTSIDKEYSWKEIALLLDEVTMYIYLFLVTLLTVIIACVMLAHYSITY